MVSINGDDGYFPRGGAQGEAPRQFPRKKTFVFENKKGIKPNAGVKNPGKRQREKLKKLKPPVEDEVLPVSEKIQTLSLQNLRVGTKTLCCVNTIVGTQIKLDLPGKVFAGIHLKSISQPFTNFLEDSSSVKMNRVKALRSAFQPGDVLSCKVDKIERNGSSFKVSVTTEPSEVNSDMDPTMVFNGTIFMAAIKDVEDHGYTLHTGVSGLTAFLPKENTTQYLSSRSLEDLAIGSLVWCKVVKATHQDSVNRAEVTIDPEEVKKAKTSRVTPQTVYPGVRIDLTVTKVSDKHLRVSSVVNNEVVGFISKSSLDDIKMSEIHVGYDFSATVLYSYPLSSFFCFTMKTLPSHRVERAYSLPGVIDDAEICGHSFRGVDVSFRPKMFAGTLKGFIPFSKMEGQVNSGEVESKFPIGNHLKVKIVDFNYLDEVYICSTSDELLSAKISTSYDVEPGELVKVTIDRIKEAGIIVKLDAMTAFVPKNHLTDVVMKNPESKFPIKSVHSGRVLRVDHHANSVHVTLRPTLVKTAPLTKSNYTSVANGNVFYGTVKAIKEDCITVSFYNGLSVAIPQTRLILPPHKHHVDELVKCYVVEASNTKRPVMSLVRPVDQMDLGIGRYHPIIVKEVTNEGLSCCLVEQDTIYKAFIPTQHLSDHLDLTEFVLKMYPVGSIIKNAVLYCYDKDKPIFSMRESVRHFVKTRPDIFSLRPQDIIPSTVYSLTSDSVYLAIPVPHFNGLVAVKSKNVDPSLQLAPGQVVMASVTKVNPKYVTIGLSLRVFGDILPWWPKMNLINIMKSLTPYQDFPAGTIVTATVSSKKNKPLRLKLENCSKKVVLLSGELEASSSPLEFRVMFDDIWANELHVVPFSDIKSEVKGKTQVKFLFENRYFLGGVDTVTGRVVYLPNQKVPNRIENDVKLENFKGTPVDVWIVGYADEPNLADVPLNCLSNSSEEENGVLIARIDESAKKKRLLEDARNKVTALKKVKLQNDLEITEVTATKKQKPKSQKDFEITEVTTTVKAKPQNDFEITEVVGLEKVKQLSSGKNQSATETCPGRKRKADEDRIAQKLKERKLRQLEGLSLENVGAWDWSATTEDLSKIISGPSHDPPELDEDDDDDRPAQKKISPAERKKAAIAEERRLRQTEEEIFNSDQDPKSADQFDRVLMGDPHNSKTWIQYMAFHLQSAEVDKARAVALRALSRIDPRMEEERRNVWISLLNLDMFYSPPEVFKETLNDALRYNDDYAINSRVLELYVEANKHDDLEQLTNSLVRKYKDKLECWIKCMSALMTVGLHSKARYFLQRSLNSLPLKEHITLISRFALLENKFGFNVQAQALFENLLTSYPARVDIWSVYVDMLVKSSSIDLARNVLERATSNKLPLRKMRGIYKKWLAFEEIHGSSDQIAKVKALAKDYVDVLEGQTPQTRGNENTAEEAAGPANISRESDESDSNDDAEFSGDSDSD